jgi:peptide/nickel transport system substrate-binding protein
MRRLLLAAAALLPFALPAQAQDTANLRIALREDPDLLDPTLSRTYVGRIVLVNLCQSLFTYNDKLEIVPELAASSVWTDNRTLVIKLRPGLTFHDGTPVDAAAVKYSLERHATLAGSARKAELASMDHIDVIDPHTVRIGLKAPDAVFLSQLAVRSGVLVSPTAAEALGKDFGTKPVCAGPYKFVDRVAQDHITLEKYPAHPDAAKYHFNRVTFSTVVDGAVRLANLRAGAIDIAEYVVATDADTVKKDPKLKLVISDGLGYQGITFNLGHGPRSQTPIGQDPRVRRAFELAIDRAAIVKVVYNGLYTPVAQPVPASSPFFAPAVQPPIRDVAAARALLAEAGVKTPILLTLTVPNSPDTQQVGVVLQSMAAEAGFEVKLDTMEFASSLDKADRGDFQAYLIGWSGRPDADGNIRDLLRTAAPLNYGGYASPEFDRLIDQAKLTADLPARRELYARAFTRLHDDLPILYLYTPRNIVGMSARISGFVPVPDGMLRLAGVTMSN